MHGTCWPRSGKCILHFHIGNLHRLTRSLELHLKYVWRNGLIERERIASTIAPMNAAIQIWHRNLIVSAVLTRARDYSFPPCTAARGIPALLVWNVLIRNASWRDNNIIITIWIRDLEPSRNNCVSALNFPSRVAPSADTRFIKFSSRASPMREQKKRGRKREGKKERGREKKKRGDNSLPLDVWTRRYKQRNWVRGISALFHCCVARRSIKEFN